MNVAYQHTQLHAHTHTYTHAHTRTHTYRELNGTTVVGIDEAEEPLDPHFQILHALELVCQVCECK
jgi:hypothetical protein